MFSTYFALILTMFRAASGGPQTEFTATPSESPAAHWMSRPALPLPGP
jgi:hypothetical protein